jgi:uncharacterized damage-inducible protein DinB
MKNKIVTLLAGILVSGMAMAQQQSGGDRTMAAEMQAQLANIEREVVSAAEAMPEAKFNFAPTQGEFKGVRDFLAQVKHVAGVSYMVCSAISGQQAPEGRAGEDGPAAIKSKSEAVSYLKDAFAYCNKAYGTLDANTALQPVKAPFGTSSRLALASFNNSHCMDHYGQMVVYLRMNGIVPPASRPRR